MEIDSSGTFRSGDVRLDVRFRDAAGNEYVWYPKWDDVRNLYTEAERVEDLNPGGNVEELDKLKELKKLDDTVIKEISEIIAETWQGDDLGDFFRGLGYDVDYGFQVEEHVRTFPAETGGPERVRKTFVFDKLCELNDKDYQLVVEVIEEAAAPKQHIEEEDRHEMIRYRLNMALQHEGWWVTRGGKVQPVQYYGDDSNDHDS